MAINGSLLWQELGTKYWIASLMPIVAGGALTAFKTFIADEKTLTNRADLLRQRLLEGINQRLHALIAEGLKALDFTVLRGAPPATPDLVARHTDEVFRVRSIFIGLTGICTAVQRIYTFLLITIILGFLTWFLGTAFEDLKSFCGLSGFLLFLFQAVAALLLRHNVNRLTWYEQNT